MSHRPFSNNKIISYNEYIKQKKCYTKNLCQKRFIDSYSMFINLKQKHINNCRSIYPCVKAPMTIIQGKTSYICDNNDILKNDDCKIIKQTLYPYGYYLCNNNVCNACVNSSAESNQNTSTTTNQTINDYNLLDLFVQ